MDQVQDRHAAEKVGQLHAPVQMQDKDRVILLRLLIGRTLHIEIPKQRTDHVKEQRVEAS